MTSTGELYSSLRNRVAIVTGGSRGLGREMVLELVSAGAHLAVIGSQAGPALDNTVAEANRSGPGRAMALVADVSDNDQCEAAVATTLAALGRVDVLVNNAGLGMRRISERFNTTPTRFWETDPAAWRDIIDTNVNGPFQMARAVVPHMLAQGFGKIINISTSDQTMVRRGYAPYGPSKAALEAASRVWAQDLAGTGIDVNVYLPGGAADTDLLPPSPDKKGADGNLLPATIMRHAIRWLAADESNGITGARFIARLWDETLPPADAAHLARSPAVDKPAIL